MDCEEARALIDAGVRPGSGDQSRTRLGFHLSGCTRCRAYRAEREPADEALLDALLAAEPPLPPLRSLPPLARPRRRLGPLRRALLVLLALLVGWLGFVAGQIAYAAYTIGANVAAMQQLPTPALQVPTAAPPSPAPQLPGPGATATSPPPAAVRATAAPAPPTASPPAAPPTAGPPAAPPPPPSITPVRLPAIDGTLPLPTLMPTVGIADLDGDAVTILLLGSDRRPGEGWTTRSDAIVVVRLDPSSRRVAMLSLPRDLIVSMPGYGQGRINAATVYGDLNPQLGGGTELARRTVGGLLGLPIDYVVRADFQAFTRAVDAIGGVEIEVEQPLYDPLYPTIDYGYTEVYFPAGRQRMDGATALVYSRIRHPDSAYARERRQQQVLLAIMRQVRDQNILGQVQMIADLSSELREDIRTDLSVDQMLGLAWAFRDISPERVERYALDENGTVSGAVPDDPYALLARPGAVEALVRLLVRGPDAP